MNCNNCYRPIKHKSYVIDEQTYCGACKYVIQFKKDTGTKDILKVQREAYQLKQKGLKND